MEPVLLALCSSVSPTWQTLRLFGGDHVAGTDLIFAQGGSRDGGEHHKRARREHLLVCLRAGRMAWPL